jgi:hypothetical protein
VLQVSLAPQRPGASTNNGSRSALATQGLETFHGADYMMVVYGCYRTGPRVLGDFDLLKANAAQVGVGPFARIALVDDGGQITRRHDAYYMGTDGTRMQAAYVSAAPVRYVIEFDNVGEQINSVALVHGSEQIKNVPITASGAKAQ